MNRLNCLDIQYVLYEPLFNTYGQIHRPPITGMKRLLEQWSRLSYDLTEADFARLTGTPSSSSSASLGAMSPDSMSVEQHEATEHYEDNHLADERDQSRISRMTADTLLQALINETDRKILPYKVYFCFRDNGLEMF